MAKETMKLIEQRLQAAFSPTSLSIGDESHRHAGHQGMQDGRGHYVLTIASAAFAGKSPLQRHRMVYDALGELMQTHIHALKIKAIVK